MNITKMRSISLAVLTALLLTLALASVTFAQDPPGLPQPTSTPDPEPTSTPGPQPTSTPDPEPTSTPDPEPTSTPGPQPTSTPNPEPTSTPGPQPPSAPSPEEITAHVQGSPNCSTDMIDNNTPICISPVENGLHLYYIGDRSDAFPNGVSLPEPFSDVKSLADEHPAGSGNVLIRRTTNPVSGAPVILTYLSDDRLLHFHTYTWDRYYERWKLYIFVVDENNNVSVWER